MGDELDKLMRWYHSYCDGEWEHGYGIKIDTLDNPGWRIDISLKGTALENLEFEAIEVGLEHETNWVSVGKKYATEVYDSVLLSGACGPLMLKKMLAIVVGVLETHDKQFAEILKKSPI